MKVTKRNPAGDFHLRSEGTDARWRCSEVLHYMCCDVGWIQLFSTKRQTICFCCDFFMDLIVLSYSCMVPYVLSNLLNIHIKDSLVPFEETGGSILPAWGTVTAHWPYGKCQS